jgi:hypothetical protein
MAYAGTGVPQAPTQSLRERQYSREMIEKPKEQPEQDSIADICIQAENNRLARIAAAEPAQIAAGKIRYV